MSDFKTIVKSIKEANQSGALVKDNDILTGTSGQAHVGTLQRLAKLLDKDTCYLEIGVFQGLTLLSVANAIKDVQVFGIDNFELHDKRNEETVHERTKKLNLNNVNLIKSDYEDALENLTKYIKDKKVGLFYIDGPHDYRSQMMCLLLSLPYLSKNAIIIVDDSNYRHVRQANRDFLVSFPEFKMIYESYTAKHPSNMNKKEIEEASNGWMDGVNIIVRDPDNELAPFFPETIRERTLYENEHVTHASKYAHHLPFIVKFSSRLGFLLNPFLKSKKALVGKYYHSNTFSENLTKGEFNSSVR